MGFKSKGWRSFLFVAVGLSIFIFSLMRIGAQKGRSEAGPQRGMASSSPLSKKSTAPSIPLPKSLPPDFDWKIYVSNYHDLQKAHIDSKEKAERHWLSFGYREGRVYDHKLP